jgi:hypothetical protein
MEEELELTKVRTRLQCRQKLLDLLEDLEIEVHMEALEGEGALEQLEETHIWIQLIGMQEAQHFNVEDLVAWAWPVVWKMETRNTMEAGVEVELILTLVPAVLHLKVEMAEEGLEALL